MNLKRLATKIVSKIAIKTTIKTWVCQVGIVAIEPASFLFMVSLLMTDLFSQDLMIDRICKVNLSFNTTTCQGILKVNETFEDEEAEVQKVAAEIRSLMSFFSNIIPCFLILIVGPWSDIYGRKLPMLLGIFANVVESVVLLLLTFIPSADGWTVVIVSRVLKSLFGADPLFLMAANSYISDTTDESSRTIRLGFFTAAYMLGVPAGFSIGGAITKADLGFVLSFIISISICAIAFFIILFRVDNKISRITNEENRDDSDEEQHLLADERNVQNPRGSFKSILLSTKTNLFQIYEILCKNKENNRHLHLWALFFAHACIAAPIYGETSMMYLFVRERFQWDAGDYGFFSTYNFFIGVVGNVVSLIVLSHLLKLTDPLVGFISGLSQIAGSLIYAFATSAFLMYLAPTIDMMNGTMAVIARSMISKKVLPDEIGKMFTLIEIINSALHLIVNPLYGSVYRLSIDTFSGNIFIMSAALSVPPLLIFAWFYWKIKSDAFSPKDMEEDLNKNYEPLD